jgi:hypothetical protein
MAPKGSEADVTIKIPRPLYAQLKQVIGGSGFHSVTEFIVYVLRDLMSHHAEGRGLPAIPQSAGRPEVAEGDVDPLSADEIEAIRKRLTSLGYL